MTPFLVRPRFAHHILNCDIDGAKRLLAKYPEWVLRPSRVFIRSESLFYTLAHQGPGLPDGKEFYHQLCSRRSDNDPEVSELMRLVITGLENPDELIEKEQLQAETYVRERLKTRPHLIFASSLDGPAPLQQALADGDIHMVEALLRPHLIDSKMNAWHQKEACEKHDALIRAHEQAKDTWKDQKQWEKKLLRLKHERWIARTSIFMRGLPPEIYAKVVENVKAIKPSWLYDTSVITGLCHQLIKLVDQENWNEVDRVFCTLQQLVRKSMPRHSVADCFYYEGRPNHPCPNFYEDRSPRRVDL